MVLLLFTFKHMTMYMGCQLMYLSLYQPNIRYAKRLIESLLISAVSVALTHILGKIFPTAFIGLITVILTGVYHHLRGRSKLTDTILIHIDLYTLSLFSNMVLGGLAYSMVYAIIHTKNYVITAILNQTLYIGEMSLGCWLTNRRKRRETRPYWFMAFSILCCMLMMCNFVIIMPYHFTRIHAELTFILVSIVSFIVLLVWLRERYVENEEKQKLLAEIRQLSSQVHHYKEFIPAMKRKFDESLALIKDREMDRETARELRPMLDEINRLYEEQLEESRLEFLEVNLLPKTEMVFLDALLERYHERAKKERIQFGAQVLASPKYLLEHKLITQLKLEELLGDLLTNAFRAVKRKEEKLEESVEIIFGISDSGFYEIDVYDSGEPFPEFVLERFGKRGLTTGGTGDGIPNMLKILQKYGISLVIEEFSPEESGFSKCMTLCFGRNFEVTLKTQRNVKLEVVSPQQKIEVDV